MQLHPIAFLMVMRRCVKEDCDHVLEFTKEQSFMSREGRGPLLEDHIYIRETSVCYRRVKRGDAGRYTIRSSKRVRPHSISESSVSLHHL